MLLEKMSFKLNKYYLILFACIFFGLPLFIHSAQAYTQDKKFTYPLEMAFGNTFVVYSLVEYIIAVYVFATTVAGVVATVAFMYYSFRYASSLGNQQYITNAKEGMTGSIIGMLLILLSYGLLNFINPQITNLDNISPSTINILSSGKALGDLTDCTQQPFKATSCAETACGVSCTTGDGDCRGTICAPESNGSIKTCMVDPSAPKTRMYCGAKNCATISNKAYDTHLKNKDNDTTNFDAYKEQICGTYDQVFRQQWQEDPKTITSSSANYSMYVDLCNEESQNIDGALSWFNWCIDSENDPEMAAKIINFEYAYNCNFGCAIKGTLVNQQSVTYCGSK